MQPFLRGESFLSHSIDPFPSTVLPPERPPAARPKLVPPFSLPFLPPSLLSSLPPFPLPQHPLLSQQGGPRSGQGWADAPKGRTGRANPAARPFGPSTSPPAPAWSGRCRAGPMPAFVGAGPMGAPPGIFWFEWYERGREG